MNKDEFLSKYYINRKNTNSIKWDTLEDNELLPVFIADMDFASPFEISENLHKWVDHLAYGYSFMYDDYFDVYNDYHKRHNNISYQKEDISFANGAISAINDIINTFTNIDDHIMINTPVYHNFKNTILNTKRQVSNVRLIKNDDAYFTMDYKNIEEVIIKDKVKMFLLCSPHNPISRVWTKDELTQLLDICLKHNVLVVSDEVHADLIFNTKHHSIFTVDDKYNDILILITAASKTFNLALFSHSQIIIKNKELREQLNNYNNMHHIGHLQTLNALPSYYAYKYGDEWLKALLEVIQNNYNIIKETLDKHNIEHTKLEGTYLIFVNLESILKDKNIKDFCLKEWKIKPNFGETMDETYNNWIRINLATSDDNIKLLCNRFEEVIKNVSL